MAPNIVQDSNVGYQWEAQLVHDAARRLDPPPQDLETAAQAALGRLVQEKERRLGRGLNHWETHAQEIAERLLREVLEEDRRQKELAEFFLATREEALAFAKAFLDREEDAEDAVSEAFARLAAGKTQPANFFRTLKHVAVDRFRRLHREQDALGSGPTQPGGSPKPGGAQRDGVRIEADDAEAREAPASQGNADSLEILLKESLIEEAIQIVLTDRRRRGIKSRKWWKDLMKARGMAGSVPDSGSPNE